MQDFLTIEKELLEEYTHKANKILNNLEQYFNHHLSIYINADVIKDICVEYQGSQLKLDLLASISLVESGTLMIRPWDSQIIKKIEDALHKQSELQVRTSTDSVYVSLPLLTFERRLQLVKLAKKTGEEFKIILRNMRIEARDKIKDILEKHEYISEEQEKKLYNLIQKIVQDINHSIDSIVAHKQDALNKI